MLFGFISFCECLDIICMVYFFNWIYTYMCVCVCVCVCACVYVPEWHRICAESVLLYCYADRETLHFVVLAVVLENEAITCQLGNM